MKPSVSLSPTLIPCLKTEKYKSKRCFYEDQRSNDRDDCGGAADFFSVIKAWESFFNAIGNSFIKDGKMDLELYTVYGNIEKENKI